MAKFKTRARAVDMLGRQQIAGVPNAISELFKNAHDAYADVAEIDYFRSDGLFVLRDDGLGMTREDFENRWLTIGTESKLGSLKGEKKPPKDINKKERPITGEKGIGRLSIAVIGSQVFIMSRAKRGEELQGLVASFIHWGLFEIPGVNLEEIEIPVETFSEGEIPSNSDVKKMVNSVKDNVISLASQGFIDDELKEKLVSDLENFNLDLKNASNYLGDPSLFADGHGTHFYIKPAREDLADDLDNFNRMNSDNQSRIQKLLLGFTNTMIPNHPDPNIQTAFRYWSKDDHVVDVIGEGAFFSQEEFETVDHHFQGRFDEQGQFVGIISVYGEEFKNYVIAPPKNKLMACGAFDLNLAYLPGSSGDSTVPPEEYARLSTKVNAIGGLYIYKDDIRILPYGDNEFDFLSIEKRRTLRAGTYFFSYRRMFGSVELTQENNRKLAEKAGREGFQDNQAYRDFREILINFFVQVAAEFFAQGGKNADVYETTRANIRHQREIIKKRQSENASKLKYFEKQLTSFFNKSENRSIQKEVEQIVYDAIENIDKAIRSENIDTLFRLESSTKNKLNQIRTGYEIQKPTGIGLPPELAREWDTYLVEYQKLTQETFEQQEAQIQELFSDSFANLEVVVNQKKRLQHLIDSLFDTEETQMKESADVTGDNLLELHSKFDQLRKDAIQELDSIRKQIETEITSLEINETSNTQFAHYRQKYERLVDEKSTTYINIFQYIQSQVELIKWDKNVSGELIGQAEETAMLEQELLALQDNEDSNIELIQLGMALAIISHEFTNTITAIRRAIRSLRSWANSNPQLKPIYDDIYESFNHLDGYLTLFTPLNRRLYRNSTEITGSDIAKYIKNVFQESFEQHKIDLEITPSFRKLTIIGYPSTFYPIFVNLIDNSIYWLQKQDKPPIITLDEKDGAFIISDNGPGIPSRDRQSILELGFTRKPGGRGMGLYISNEVLKKEGFELQLIETSETIGTTFAIKQMES